MTGLLRGLITVSAVALVCAGGGLALANAMPSEYRATALLQVGPALTGSATLEALTAAEMLARGQVELVTAPNVLTPAMDRLGWTDAETFRQRIDVAWVPATSIVRVSFKDADPDRARRAANAVAESFVERTRAFQTADRASATRELDAQIAMLQDEVRVLNSDIERHRARIGPPLPAGAPPSSERALAEAYVLSLEVSRQLKQDTLGLLHVTSGDLGLDRTLSDGVRIAEAARLPEGRQIPALLDAGLAALPGTLVALAALLLARWRGRRPRLYLEAAAALRVEVLGTMRPLGNPGTPGLSWQGRLEADDVRALHLNLLAVGEPIRSLLVTSPLPRERRSLVAAHLALASAEAGTATVLVDADLRQPSQHRNFKVDPSFGLVNLLADPASIRDSLARFRIAERLFVIPVGLSASTARETVAPAALRSLLDEVLALTQGFAIVDGGSLLSQSETLALAHGVDGVLVLADPTSSSPRDMQRAIRLLQRVRANVLGLVLDRVDRTTLVPVRRLAGSASGHTTTPGRPRARPTVASWLLLVWAALLGVQLQQEFIPHFYVAVSDVVLIPLSAIVAIDPQLRRRALAMPTTLVWFFVAMACAVALGSLVDALTLGFVPREGWLNKGLGLAVLAASIACVRAIAATRESVHRVLGALAFGAIGSAGIAMLPYLDVGPLADLLPDRGVRFTGLLQDANAAGLYYTVALLLVFACIAGAPLGFGRWTRIGGTLLLGIVNVLTFSLSSFVAGLAAFSVLVAGLPGRRWPAALALAIALVLTLPFLSAAVAPATAEGDIFERAAAARSAGAESALWTEQLAGSRAAGAVAIKGASVFDRLAVLTLAFDLWTADLWTVPFGIGLGAFPVHSTVSPLATVVIIHNTYLWLPIELGVVGLAALVLLLSYIAHVSIGLLRLADRTTAIALIASLVMFLVWWQFNEGLYQRSFWLLLGAAGVLAEIAPARRSHHPAQIRAALAPSELRA
jgi:Mrp family chromosome partitioning ATPase